MKERRKRIAPEENQTEEMLLLTCSPHITGYNLEHLAKLVEMMVISSGENFYAIRSTHIDAVEHEIYGHSKQLEEYGEFK
jgi:hypothetical protein